ncbi:MAG TPA: hypothetical protein PLL21_02110 [Sedimentibacter sp.]|nr:hypothetical protein [Sedimentibacter sp.]HOH69465.1 hypothetical protein [Sedimentibacter sp.]HQB63151.1 hypothetical protein [Sedimentibacter sp.]
MPINDNVHEQMQNWELQQKQESQKELRDKYEYMNDKYQKMKNDYTSFKSARRDKNEEIYNNSSDQTGKNPYMRYELNNTFKNKDDKKESK